MIVLVYSLFPAILDHDTKLMSDDRSCVFILPVCREISRRIYAKKNRFRRRAARDRHQFDFVIVPAISFAVGCFLLDRSEFVHFSQVESYRPTINVTPHSSPHRPFQVLLQELSDNEDLVKQLRQVKTDICLNVSKTSLCKWCKSFLSK